MANKYQKVKIGGSGDALGNKINLNYEGSRRCPDGYIWISGHNKRVGMFGQGKVYVTGHCRKVTDSPEIENRTGI